ncbi:GDSL-type esterase/lipase family protein [Fructobacillus tropaeoli]|uniref:GDSL-type esterase/lipase family protein n=1 Tax=Fructobacillus tropaeoli TaxID=709323 RepID=UPI001940DFB0|nr:GDSL-type esterase/lipase family protein [Fructobacillus tropaeoli]GIC69731.1 hypothetical protein FT12353_03690 [Fructobacillus tropaeoli]
MRFKMYKSGKYWAVGSLLIAGLFGALAVQSNNVSADDNGSSSSLVSSSPNASVVADNPSTVANGITKNDQGFVNYVDGTKQTNAWDQTNTYYFGADGQAVSGLQTIGGKQYYFGDDQTYTVRKSIEVTVNNQTYTADQNGVLTAKNGLEKNQNGYVDYVNGVKQTNAWDQTNTYYFGADGQAVSGLQTIGGKQYYFGDDQTYTVRKNTEVTVNNQTYTADQNGILTAKNGLEKNQNGYVDYVNGTKQTNAWDQTNTHYFGADGQAVSGLQTINGKQYYFGDDQTYTVRKNMDITFADTTYTSASDGSLSLKNGVFTNAEGLIDYQNGLLQKNTWVVNQGSTYYFGSDGQAVSGLQSINGSQYFFGDNQSYQLQVSFDTKINNVTYHADKSGRLTPKNGVIWGFGDSTTVGWNSYNDGSQSYDSYAAQDLDKLYLNTSAHSGTQIGNDMSWMVDEAIKSASYSTATDIVIGMGVNDINYGGTSPLNTIIQIYQDSIRRLHEANPNIRIYILLPQGDYLNGKNNDTIGPGGFSMNQLRAALTQVGNNLGITVINAGVVTDENHATTLPDGVHPTNATYQAIGTKIAQAMQANPNNTYQANYQNYSLGTVSGYYNTLAGYEWLENGQVYTGFQKYYGAYYWFNNGVRDENSWHQAWGNTYYVGGDGRSVQGFQTIDGNLYYFGNDGSFTLRMNQAFSVNGLNYFADDRGIVKVVMTGTGYLYDGSEYNGGYRWYENGQLYTGFRFYMGTYYWFVDGVRQNEGWRTAWGYKYWTDANGRAVQGLQIIDGKQYYFGDDGTYYARENQMIMLGNQEYKANGDGILQPWSGYVYDASSYNGGYRWYENGQLYTGFRYYMGTYYWFVDGVRQNEGWRSAWGYKYWTDANGRAVQGLQIIDGHSYNFGNDGTYFLRG